MRSRQIIRWHISSGSVLAAAALLVTGCIGGGSDGGGVAPDSSTVMGNVGSVTGSANAGAIIHAGAVQGVQIGVSGTDLRATTAEDGLFVISGVPPGDQQLVFGIGAQQATATISVPPNSTIQIGQVSINGSNASLGNVQVDVSEPRSDDPADSRSDDQGESSNDDSPDSPSSDDTSKDGDSIDDPDSGDASGGNESNDDGDDDSDDNS